MNRTITKMKKEPEKYKEILEEHKRLYEQYGREIDYKTFEEHFEIWKKWTIEHGVTPRQHVDGEEGKIAHGMYHAKTYMKKKPEEYKAKLEEHEQLRAQYGRRKLKGLGQQKQDAISEVRELKGQVEQAEELYNRTQEAIDKAMADKSKTIEGPGE